jgi:tetratricopeptide (TPR) repeat protein
LVERFPDDPHALTLAGRINYAFGDEAAAGKCWEQCLTLHPNFAAAWSAQGETAWEKGDYENAVRHFRSAINADPALQVQLAYMLSDCLLNLGKPREAGDELELATQQVPHTPDSRLLLATILLQLREHQKAKDQFDLVLAEDPESSKAYFGLATAHARLGQPDEAEKYRQEYARRKADQLADTRRFRAEYRGVDLADVHPVASDCYVNVGRIYAVHGDLHSAEKHWLRAIELAPQNVEARMLLRRLYGEQGRGDGSLRLEEGGASISPQLGQ